VEMDKENPFINESSLEEGLEFEGDWAAVREFKIFPGADLCFR
jgi:hypothetical protein